MGTGSGDWFLGDLRLMLSSSDSASDELVEGELGSVLSIVSISSRGVADGELGPVLSKVTMVSDGSSDVVSFEGEFSFSIGSGQRASIAPFSIWGM